MHKQYRVSFSKKIFFHIMIFTVTKYLENLLRDSTLLLLAIAKTI